MLKIHRSSLQWKELALLLANLLAFLFLFYVLYFVKQKGPESRKVAFAIELYWFLSPVMAHLGQNLRK